MHEAQKDTKRAIAAAKAIFDDRDPVADFSSILVTTEQAVATILLAIFQNDPAKAAAMLNEGLVPGIESRLSIYAKDKP